MPSHATTLSGAPARASTRPQANTSRNTLDTIAQWVRDCGAQRVLDVPCGEGALLAMLQPHVASCAGGDLQPQLFTLPDVTCYEVDLQTAWPLESGAYDAVVCADGIEHVENPFHVTREAARVLAPGGYFILSTPNIQAIRSRWRFLWSGFHNKFKRPLDETRRDPLHHINPIGFPELRYVLHTSGFVIERVGMNRIKPASWPYAILYPFVALYTWLAFRHEHSRTQEPRNTEILHQLLSPALFLGETLILQARKQG